MRVDEDVEYKYLLILVTEAHIFLHEPTLIHSFIHSFSIYCRPTTGYLVHARSAIHVRFIIAIYNSMCGCNGFCLIHFFHNPRRCPKELGYELMFHKRDNKRLVGQGSGSINEKVEVKGLKRTRKIRSR